MLRSGLHARDAGLSELATRRGVSLTMTWIDGTQTKRSWLGSSVRHNPARLYSGRAHWAAVSP
jgi:hypothetical protein